MHTMTRTPGARILGVCCGCDNLLLLECGLCAWCLFRWSCCRKPWATKDCAADMDDPEREARIREYTRRAEQAMREVKRHGNPKSIFESPKSRKRAG